MLFLLPLVLHAGPLDFNDPRDWVPVWAAIFIIISIGVLLVADLMIWLVLRLSKKKWKWQWWVLFNVLFLIIVPIGIYGFFYDAAESEDQCRENAYTQGLLIKERFKLEGARVYDGDFYYSKGQHFGSVVLWHIEDTLSAQVQSAVDSVPCLVLDYDENRNVPELPAENNSQESRATLPEPLDLTKLQVGGRLDFTSGGLARAEHKNYCDKTDSGFYGRYHLIDKAIKKGHPVIGHIDIYKKGEMLTWKANDADQKIWEIQLRSNVLAVCDSLQVGLPKEKVMAFNTQHGGQCRYVESNTLGCLYANFSLTHIFENDTLSELSLTRLCPEPTL